MRRRTWGTTLLMIVLGAAPVAARSQAVPAPKTTKYFLHIGETQAGVAGEFDFYMDTRDYPDAANGAGTTSNGLHNEVIGTTGVAEPARNVFPVRDRLPLRLDARRSITGQVAVQTFESNVFVPVPLGGGLTVMELDLLGTPAGSEEAVVIASQVVEFLMTPLESQHVVDVEMEAAPALHGTTFTDVSLTTYFHGPSLLTGFFELDDPPSFVEVPTLRPART